MREELKIVEKCGIMGNRYWSVNNSREKRERTDEEYFACRKWF